MNDYTYMDYIISENVIENVPKNIFYKCNAICIYGKTKSGKTSCIIDIYKKILSKIFDVVFVFCKNDDTIKTYKNMEPNMISYKFDSDEKKSRELFKQFYEQLNNDKESVNQKKMILIDDFYDSNIGLNTGIIQFFISGRHLNCTTIFIAQYSKVMVSPILKNNSDLFIILKAGLDDKNNMINILKNALSLKNTGMTSKQLEEMANKIYKEKVMDQNYNALIVSQNGEIYHYKPKRKYEISK